MVSQAGVLLDYLMYCLCVGGIKEDAPAALQAEWDCFVYVSGCFTAEARVVVLFDGSKLYAAHQLRTVLSGEVLPSSIFLCIVANA